MTKAASKPGPGPLIVARDIDGFFGLLIDNLVNLLVIVAMLQGVFGMPAAIVYGRVIPGAVLSILAGNIFYTIQARRLARRQGRSDVTTLPYGISTPIMFAYLVLVIGPVFRATKDPHLAWRVGVSAAFIGGVIEFAGAFMGGYIRRVTPRAAMLGTLAGIAITFIAMKPTLAIWEHPQIGFLPLAVILTGFVARIVFPLRVPAGFLAIVSGTAVAWAIGFQKWAAVTTAWKGIGFHFPLPVVADLWEGFGQVAPFLVVVLPMGVYNFLETMQNVESAAAAGDEYDTRTTMMADGAGTMIGALFGSCFPTTVYIGHPGWKAVGARQGYTLLNGVTLFVIGIFGFLSVAAAIIPKEVAFCILLYIGVVIGAQAFRSSPPAHAAAVVIAFLPHIANFVCEQVKGTLRTQGIFAVNPELAAKLLGEDVHFVGLKALGEGAIVTGLLLGAITVFLIDRKPAHAAAYAGVAAVFAFFGVIHAPQLAWAAARWHAFGYGILALFFAALSRLPTLPETGPELEGV